MPVKGVALYFLGLLDELPPGGTHVPSGQHGLARDASQDGLQAPQLEILWRGRRYPGGVLNFQLHSVIPRLLKEAPWEGLPLPSMVKDGLQGICVQNDVMGTNRVQ